MTRARYAIIPQRNDGYGWTTCSPHRASGWLVADAITGKLIARYASKRTAEQRIRQLGRPKAAVSPEPGSRATAPRPDAPVARSLTRAEYNALILGAQ